MDFFDFLVSRWYLSLPLVVTLILWWMYESNKGGKKPTGRRLPTVTDGAKACGARGAGNGGPHPPSPTSVPSNSPLLRNSSIQSMRYGVQNVQADKGNLREQGSTTWEIGNSDVVHYEEETVGGK